jgi:hypothetical protein
MEAGGVMGKLFTQGWYDRVEALLALAMAKIAATAAGAATGTALPWVNVPAGTAVVWTPADGFLSFDATGPVQSTLALPVAASLLGGETFYARLTGTGTVNPIVISAGAGTTVEQVGGPLGPGNFGASAYLPQQAMVVAFKYDRPTTSWKIFSFDIGIVNAAQNQPTWVVAGGGADSNSGLDAGHALLTQAEVIRRLLGIVGDINSSNLALRPLGGGADDWPRLFDGIFPAAIATGLSVTLQPGLNLETWLARSLRQVPSKLHLLGTTTTRVVAALPLVGISGGLFDMLATQAAGITLAIDNTPGTRVVRVTAAPGGGWVLGSFVQLQIGAAHLAGSTYTIKLITPVGPDFDLTFERDVIYQARAASAQVVPVTNVPQDIRIEGNGMTLSGSCSIFVEVEGGVHVEVSGLEMDGTLMPAGTDGLVFDTNCLECSAGDIRVDGAGNMQNGVWIIGEGHRVGGLLVKNCTTNNVVFGDVSASTIGPIESYGCPGNGLSITADGGALGAVPSSNNAHDIVISGCGGGCVVDQAATDFQISNLTSRFNAIGLHLANTGPLGNPEGIRVTNADLTNNTQNGALIDPGVKKTVLNNVDVSFNGSTGITSQDDVTGMGIVSRGGNPTSALFIQGGYARLSGLDLTCDVPAGTLVTVIGAATRGFLDGHLTAAPAAVNSTLVQHTSGQTSLSRMRWTFNANAEGVIGLAGVVLVDEVSADGTNLAASVGMNIGNTCTARVGDHVDLANLGTPFNFNAGSHWNRSAIGPGVVTLAGLAPQAVVWPDLKASDDVWVEITDPNGGVPSPVRVVNTPGTGFTLAGTTAADTSQVNYAVR